MKKFREVSRKIVSIKAIERAIAGNKRTYLDDEDEAAGSSKKVNKPTRDMLILEALIDPDNMDLKTVYQLATALLDESSSVSAGGTPSLFYALVLCELVLQGHKAPPPPPTNEASPSLATSMLGMMSSSKINVNPTSTSNPVPAAAALSPAALLKWGESHFEYWTRRGVAAEEFHLLRARQLFEQAFKRNKQLETAATMHTYCRILCVLGDMEAAAAAAVRVVTDFEHDAEYGNYLFYTGGVYKAMGQHEKANSFFFDASEVGPPRLFSKLEMMMIISRTIEQEHSNDDVDEEDAYKMVHAHLQLEGVVDEDLEYDDWISDSETWLQLGDKCVLHHMYSLATDFYGLGIMKDPDAFKKPMLWLRFAKSCKRCGRSADGQLAIEQALSYDPFNPQLLRTLTFWSTPTTHFQTVMSTGVAAVLRQLPKEFDQKSVTISRAQALIKGVLERRGMNLGVGNRRDITRRMTARLGVILDAVQDGKTVKHPVILTVRPAWSGLITNIRVFDLQNNHLGAIPLHTPFAPMKETGTPRKLTLSLSCRRVTLRVRAGGVLNGGGDGCGFESDEEEQVEVHGRLVYRKKAPVYVKETFTELKFKFTDLDTGDFTCRRMKLNINAIVAAQEKSIKATLASGQYKVAELTPSEYKGAEGVTSADLSFDDSHTNEEVQDKAGELVNVNQLRARSTDSSKKMWRQNSSTTRPSSLSTAGAGAGDDRLIRRLCVSGDADDAAAVTETNIESAEILRAGFQQDGKYYFIRIVNEIDVTQVTILQFHTNRMFVFLMTREHIDRTHNISKRLARLLLILSSNALVQPLFEGRPPLAVEAAAMLENPCMCCDKHCYVNLHPHGRGATIILVDPQNRPILGTGFELLSESEDPPSIENSPVASPVFARAPSGRFLPRAASVRGASMRRMPSGRILSSKSFRNSAVDEFLNGNMNPPAFPREDEDSDEEDAGQRARSLSYKGRLISHVHDYEKLPVIESAATLSRTDSFVSGGAFSEEGAGVDADGEGAAAAEADGEGAAAAEADGEGADGKAVEEAENEAEGAEAEINEKEEEGQGKEETEIKKGAGEQSEVEGEPTAPGDSSKSPSAMPPIRATSTVSSVDPEEEEDGFELAPLPTVTAKPSPMKPTSVKVKRTAKPRVAAARVRSIARHGMSSGLTLEKALEAARKLQAGDNSPYSGMTLSAKGRVSFDEWDADQREEQRVAEQALTNYFLDETDFSSSGDGDAGGSGNFSGDGDGGEGDDADDEGAGADLQQTFSGSRDGGRSAIEYIKQGEEEVFLKAIVDVPWIEELASIEAAEYALMDITSSLLRSVVARIAEHYTSLPIFNNFVEEVVRVASENALECLLDELDENTDYAIEDVTELVCEEIFEEAVDDATEEKITKLNVLAFKQAVAAEKEAAVKAAKAAAKKPITGLPRASVKAADKHSAHAKPAAVAPVPEPVVEVKKEEIHHLRVADVPFSQPYRAAPESPKSATPVVYNVQKIAFKAPVDKRSSRPNFQRDSLVPVLNATVVGKKRHTPSYLLAAQDYHPPEYLGRQSPLNSVYTGTFSRSDAFPGEWSESLDAVDSVSSRVATLKKVENRPGSRSQLLHFNTISPLPVFSPSRSSAAASEIAECTDMTKPSKRVLGLRKALQEQGTGGGSGGDGDGKGHSASLLTIRTVDEAELQPFRASHTAPGAMMLGRTSMHLSESADDDDGASVKSEASGGSSPAFRAVQLRKFEIPVEEESVYSMGSASRSGARRSPNKRTMLDAADYYQEPYQQYQQGDGGGSDSVGGSVVGSIAESLRSLGEHSHYSTATGLMSLRSSTGHMTLLPRHDPLKVPPHGARAKEKKRIVQESLHDFQHLGYVKDRPVVHASHWRSKVFTYLAGLKNADQLRKHVAMLTKATKVVLTPEEAVCALADTSGCVGEVADKLKSLDFFSELKLVCRSLHVRSMVCMVEGGERLFRSSADTFGEHGEFDDFSMFSDQEMRDKKNTGADITRSLQFSRSVTAQTPAVLKQALSKTLPPGGSQLNLLGGLSTKSTASAFQQQQQQALKSSTAPNTLYGQRVFDDDDLQQQQEQKGGVFTAPANLHDQQGLGTAGSRGNTAGAGGSPSLSSLFHLEGTDQGYCGGGRAGQQNDDDNSSVTSLSMSLGSLSTLGNLGGHYPGQGNPTNKNSKGRHPGISRTNTGGSAVSASSATSAQSHSSSASVLADEANSKQIAPGIRSILTVPLQTGVMDVTAQSASVQSKASFVPLKFASTGGSSRRLSMAQIMSGSGSSKLGMGDSRTKLSFSDDSNEEEASPLRVRGEGSGGGGGSASGSPVQGVDKHHSQSTYMRPNWSSRSQTGTDTGTSGGAAARTEGSSPSPPRKLSRMDTTDGDFGGGGSGSFVKKLNRKSSAGSFRLAGRIDDMLVEHGETPLAIMCRRDFLKAQQDEVLLKSNKTYIRQPIERKIGLLSRSSFDGSAALPVSEVSEMF